MDAERPGPCIRRPAHVPAVDATMSTSHTPTQAICIRLCNTIRDACVRGFTRARHVHPWACRLHAFGGRVVLALFLIRRKVRRRPGPCMHMYHYLPLLTASLACRWRLQSNASRPRDLPSLRWLRWYTPGRRSCMQCLMLGTSRSGRTSTCVKHQHDRRPTPTRLSSYTCSKIKRPGNVKILRDAVWAP